MAYEALYRRFRPSRFEDAFFGQDHVKAALVNAIEGDRVGHAYLFSGPRGTGKTTSARILAKALNCTNLQGGEPCDECDSCQAFNDGSTYDLHELDAASNNGVDAMRDLIGKVALGSPGRTKVYILDEVHMLSAGAENALLKTLEEPPSHVVFVLCTTEPNKVVPTIRSRTQHLEFSLLNQNEVGSLVDHVVAEAGLEITDDDRAYVIRAGGGSARDTLSALDQVVAAGGAPRGGEHLDNLFQALVERDGPTALAAIDGAMQAGRDPATIATNLLQELRGVFLASMHADTSHLTEAEQAQVADWAASMRPAQVTRAIEVIGTSIIDMRQAPEPRVDLEVAVMRLTRPELDVTPAALLERIEALEAGAPRAAAPTAAAPPASAPAEPVEPASAPMNPPSSAEPSALAEHAVVNEPPAPPADVPAQPTAAPPSAGKRGVDQARAALAKHRSERGQAPVTPPAPAASTAQTAPAPSDPAPAASVDAAAPQSLADRRRQRSQASAPVEPVNPTAATPAPASEPSDPPALSVVPDPVPEVVESEPSSPPPPVAETDIGEPAAPEPQAPIAEPASVASADPSSEAATLPPLGQIEAAWNDGLLESMSGKVRSRFTAGRFLDHADGTARFALPNPVHRDRCEDVRAEVDAALAAKFGGPVPLMLVVDDVEPESDIFASPPANESSGSATAVDEEEEVVDVDALVDADDDAGALSGVDRVLATFEGSELLDDHALGSPDERT